MEHTRLPSSPYCSVSGVYYLGPVFVKDIYDSNNDEMDA